MSESHQDLAKPSCLLDQGNRLDMRVDSNRLARYGIIYFVLQ